jgi:hypothetical protein
MTVETWPLDRIRPYPKNARVIPQSAIDKVALSLRTYGWQQPMVVEPDGTLIVGHVRLSGALANGWTEGPVTVARDLTVEQIKAYRLMDNRSHDEATWNLELAGAELLYLQQMNFNLAETGFSLGEINSYIGTMAVDPTWDGMPEFEQQDLKGVRPVLVHFPTDGDRAAFSKLIGQPLTGITRAIWYPQAEIGRVHHQRFVTSDSGEVRYPVYVISKGRWKSRLTVNSLDEAHVPFRIVVEPQEYDLYAAVIDPERILTLPFSNLGQGSIPARNWVWEHSIGEGHRRHWIIDDNIRHFYRLHQNQKMPVASNSIFRAAEDFADRYINVSECGFNYYMFAPRKSGDIEPFTMNTRIYSCILIQNDIPFRWRGRYNEDTDLSIRALKAGWCTVLFNAFLCQKMTTMKMKGGNTDELYADDGRLKMAQSLQSQHPDVVQITRKWNRWQHHVDYTPFKNNRLMLRPGVVIPDGVDDYGMVLKRLDEMDAEELSPLRGTLVPEISSPLSSNA